MRLSKHWFVNLVMTIFPVANKVNNNILMKFLPPFSSNVTNPYDRFNVIAIYMEYRSVVSLSKVGTVRSTSILHWISSKSNLIVNNKMNRATYGISIKLLESHGLINDT